MKQRSPLAGPAILVFVAWIWFFPAYAFATLLLFESEARQVIELTLGIAAIVLIGGFTWALFR